MKRILLSVCIMFLFAGNSHAQEVIIPAGAQIEGATIFGTFAPAENVNATNFSMAIKASRNPVGVGGIDIPLKDCVIMGDVVADMSVNRAFFKATRIVCSNTKEPGGTLLKGYAVDFNDNKLGIQGGGGKSDKSKSVKGKSATPGTPAAQARFVEIPQDAKVYLFILEAASITIK
jgi:hypothetical protein